MLGELEVQRAATVLRLHGELDLLTVEDLRELLGRATAHPNARVVIDLTDVPFVDVLSLSTILAAADTQREQGGSLVVAGARQPVRRMCALLNADDVLAPSLPKPRVAGSG